MEDREDREGYETWVSDGRSKSRVEMRKNGTPGSCPPSEGPEENPGNMVATIRVLTDSLWIDSGIRSSRAALFLVSDLSGFVTGQTLFVDGGSLMVP